MRNGYRSPSLLSKDEKRVRFFMMNDMLDGVKYIKSRLDVIILYSVITLVLFTLNIINVAVAIFVKDVLKSTVSVLSYMEVAFAIGYVLGNIVLTAIAASKGIIRTMTVGVWALVLALVMLALSFNAPMAILSYFFVGATIPVWLLYLTSVQRIVPNHYQGRVSSTFNTFLSVTSLVIFFGLSYLFKAVSVRTLYVLQVVLLIIPCIMVYKYIYNKEEVQNVSEVQEASEVQEVAINE
jgi:DHA3 family macrolide efflux protein-like MFS transporter